MPGLRLVLLLVLPPAAHAVELSIQYPALQRVLAQQMFTQDGRNYVRGSQKAKCDFAYLENPRIDADRDRLRVQAHFSGRTARNFLGACIGVGDAFDLTITAIPYYRDGSVAFRDVKVESARDGFYIRRVLSAMTQVLTKDFQYRLFDDARRVLEEHRPGAPFTQQVFDFRVPQIRVMPKALVLTLEFGLLVQ